MSDVQPESATSQYSAGGGRRGVVLEGLDERVISRCDRVLARTRLEQHDD